MIIYKVTNLLDNKFYIGLSKGILPWVIKRHRNDAKNKPQYKLHLAINKYGFENFKFEVIDNSATTEDELSQLEIKYIAELKPQYNISAGGYGVKGLTPWNKGGNLPQYVKDKISLTLKGRKLTEEHKRNQLLHRKTFARSEETRRKISEAHKGRIHSEQSKRNMSEGRKKKTHP